MFAFQQGGQHVWAVVKGQPKNKLSKNMRNSMNSVFGGHIYMAWKWASVIAHISLRYKKHTSFLLYNSKTHLIKDICYYCSSNKFDEIIILRSLLKKWSSK